MALLFERAATYSRLRPIAGGADSDTRLIIEVLANGGACLECLARKTGVPAPQVTDALQQLEAIVVITAKTARCDGCLRLTQTYRISDQTTPVRPHAVSTRPRPADLAHVLWRFLTEHRGEMFCTLCLTLALGGTRRLDRVLLTTEGRGARRSHGRCSTCGKDRLLCGLAG